MPWGTRVRSHHSPVHDMGLPRRLSTRVSGDGRRRSKDNLTFDDPTRVTTNPNVTVR